MSLFSSDRERRLWIWTLVVVVGIYATLGLAQTLAGVLRDRELLDSSFMLVMILIGAAFLIQNLKRRPGRAELGIALGIIAVYLMVFLRMAIPEERTHLIEYTVVTLIIHQALTERASHGRRVPRPALLAVVAASLIGVLDECIQAVIPSRVFDTIDILFNTLASVMAILAILALSWARRLWGASDENSE